MIVVRSFHFFITFPNEKIKRAVLWPISFSVRLISTPYSNDAVPSHFVVCVSFHFFSFFSNFTFGAFPRERSMFAVQFSVQFGRISIECMCVCVLGQWMVEWHNDDAESCTYIRHLNFSSFCRIPMVLSTLHFIIISCHLWMNEFYVKKVWRAFASCSVAMQRVSKWVLNAHFNNAYKCKRKWKKETAQFGLRRTTRRITHNAHALSIGIFIHSANE